MPSLDSDPLTQHQRDNEFMDQTSSGVDWESAIADLLDELSNVQGDLLTTLTAKRDANVRDARRASGDTALGDTRIGVLVECHHFFAE